MRRSFFAVLAAASLLAEPVLAADLPVENLSIVSGKKEVRLKVEVAADDASRERGLMFRKAMADDHGMIFDFHSAQTVAFWMKNTLIPLDMLFVGPDGRIVAISKNAKPLDESAVPSREGVVALAVIEINGGLVDKLGLKPGDLVKDETVFHNR